MQKSSTRHSRAACGSFMHLLGLIAGLKQNNFITSIIVMKQNLSLEIFFTR